MTQIDATLPPLAGQVAAGPVPAEPLDATVAPRRGTRMLLVAGRAVTTVCAMFLLLDGAMKIARPAPVVEGTMQLGYAQSVIVPLGIALLASTALYAFPRTAVLGAILVTGYLGGAVATHVRVGNPLATHVLFPVYVGVLLWLGLYLRDPRLRALLPLRSRPAARR